MNMDLFAKWIDEHHLHLNVKKSLLLSRRQEPLCTYTIRVNDYPIEKFSLTSITYLVIYPGAIMSLVCLGYAVSLLLL